MSAFNQAQEATRQQVNQDDRFYRKFVYFFELRVPQAIGGDGTSFLFPLALNPQEITMDEPFAVEATATQGGGLYVEENGIVQRILRIRGHTGFKPRRLDASAGLGALAKPERKSYERELPQGFSAAGSDAVGRGLSGQRHFQWLQDRVFRTYADLKRDPATSAETSLLWHNPKDDEHWIVVPQQFTGSRSASEPTLYQYSIELLVVGRGSDANLHETEDRGLIVQIKDSLRQIQGGVDLARGAVADVTAAISEVRSILSGVDTILDSVNQVADAASDLVQGIKAVIELPLATANSVLETLDETNEFLDELSDLALTVLTLPDNLRQSFRQMGDAIERIASYPDRFAVPADELLRRQIERQQLSTNTSPSVLAASATTAPTTLQGFRALGTGLMPGDAQKARADSQLGQQPPRYTGAQQQRVRQGDTLAGLAARYLGDARLWRHIALLNGLKPPFISGLEVRDLVRGSPLPRTLGRGDAILIPTFQAPQSAQPILATHGVRLDESQEVRLLGRDFALVEDPVTRRIDIPIDVEGGAIDAKYVAGIPNLQQGLKTRLDTERGSDVLYRLLGVQRVVGLGNRTIDIEAARFRVGEAVTLDPRVGSLVSLSSETVEDRIETDMTVEIRGFSEPTTLQVTTG